MIENLHQKLEDSYEQMVEWRRHFHQYPELSFQEVETPHKISEILTSFGIEVQTGVGGRGVVGTIRGGKPGKTVALRADFDALPLEDEKEVPYKSKVPGVMHACGHDGHTATLLAVAKVLSEMRADICGSIVLIHQHAEEYYPGGAIQMIGDGCLEGVDAIFGTHLMTTLPLGVVGSRTGALSASVDGFEVTIQGRGGHGSAPHDTVDALIVATQIINQLQLVVSRRVDPLQPAVLTIGSFHAGEASNVIADKAVFKGTVRTFSPEVRVQMEREIRFIVEGGCAALHASADIQYIHSYPSIINHAQETELFIQVAGKVLGHDQVIEAPLLTGSEDFSYYLQHVPGMYFFTGAAMSDPLANFPHHHPRFDFDERAMLIAGKTLLSLVYHYLQEEEQILVD
ncbi:amidohydrolase [Brevibacillus centrosporus]|uniref:M20 metallopeptidase family protein n=1 Tax=Brevibacillus centrosporus TaxID=54910 RepID=UPI002E1E240E|nr:amidohydrolase [Brevibacillus centrosporus]MED1949551.1 amidohydrolase [Brevibacillus centrosporus]